MAFTALSSCLNSLGGLSKEMNLFITAINVAVTDILYMVALIAMKQCQGITLLAGRACMQRSSARGSQELHIVGKRLFGKKVLEVFSGNFCLVSV